MTSTDKSGIKTVAEYIKSGKCKRIVLLLGAGVSTSAGIPDFRSPGTGLYANLARLKLPYPEAVFDIKFFLNNPIPFYTLAHELYPGKYRPTPTHSFIRLLHTHSLLSMCFTQNIDTLERRAGVPSHKIIEAHGSFATQQCVKCHTPFDSAKIKEMVLSFAEKGVVPRCERRGCRGLVKPDIVFFGESLPPSFSLAPSIIHSSDLLLVLGTSLTVHPFASLPLLAPPTCPRVLINLDPVGDFGEREDDVVILGKCDEVVGELCRELGWEEELMGVWEETGGCVEGVEEVVVEEEEEEKEKEEKEEKEKEEKGEGVDGEDKELEGEVAKLAEKIGKQMGLDDNDTTEKGAPASGDAGKEAGTAKEVTQTSEDNSSESEEHSHAHPNPTTASAITSPEDSTKPTPSENKAPEAPQVDGAPSNKPIEVNSEGNLAQEKL